MYFKTVPKMRYPWKDNNKKKHISIVPDIFRRIQLDKFFNNRLLLVDYFVDDVERPEDVAHKIYGSSEYHWIVLLSNNIVDVEKEWPKKSRDLPKYVKDKYGENNSTDVHHYVDSNDTSLIVDWDAAKLANGEIKEVTNFDYEAELNDNKRQILLLDPRYTKDIIKQFKELMG